MSNKNPNKSVVILREALLEPKEIRTFRDQMIHMVNVWRRKIDELNFTLRKISESPLEYQNDSSTIALYNELLRQLTEVSHDRREALLRLGVSTQL